MARNRSLVLAPLVLLPLLLSACSPSPWHEQGMWQPNGANNKNLRAMIADPHDLTQGQSATGSDAQLAVPPVTALLSGKASSGEASQGGGASAGGGSSGMASSVGAGY